MSQLPVTAEHIRLEAARDQKVPWKKWGPYLSERQWGTVREDYSEDGDAWNYFTHDQARSRAYRWGEDGLAEYGKASPEDILIQITVGNPGPEPASLHVLPTLWFRRLWTSPYTDSRPVLRQVDLGDAVGVIGVSHPDLGERFLVCEGGETLLFTENETNSERLFHRSNLTPYVKDGIGSYLVHGRRDTVNPEKKGTKASAHYALSVGAGESRTLRLRLSDVAPAGPALGREARDALLGSGFDAVMNARRQEADEFYSSVIPATLDADAANLMRQALAGMLWSKQFYYYDVDRWLGEHGADPYKPKRRAAPRNDHWHHMYNAHILSMPDKWEYPWYAAWDLAFHVLALTLVDDDFGKEQLDLMLREPYLHPSGQIPAYEWNFGDVNPPVHAWSTIFTYRLAQAKRGKGDIDWLERSFHKLVLNFTWWVNRKDRSGSNVSEGGFLGLDNIGVFDRSAPLPTGGYLEQADGTAWMALFCMNMTEIAVELALHRPAYAEMCLKFVEHFLWIASAMMHAGEDTGMWDEEDGFFYDVLRLPDGCSEIGRASCRERG